MHSLIQRRSTLLVVAVVVMMLVFSIMPAAAQTATPVPTSAPTVLNIPTDVLFTSTNSWLTTFAPIAAIGIGITIALAVLGYLGKMIVSAFRR
jgi:hypothetical protein